MMACARYLLYYFTELNLIKINDKFVLIINSYIRPKQSSKKDNRVIVGFQVPL